MTFARVNYRNFFLNVEWLRRRFIVKSFYFRIVNYIDFGRGASIVTYKISMASHKYRNWLNSARYIAYTDPK